MSEFLILIRKELIRRLDVCCYTTHSSSDWNGRSVLIELTNVYREAITDTGIITIYNGVLFLHCSKLSDLNSGVVSESLSHYS